MKITAYFNGCELYYYLIGGSFYKKLHISCPTGLNDHIIIFDGNK